MHSLFYQLTSRCRLQLRQIAPPKQRRMSTNSITATMPLRYDLRRLVRLQLGATDSALLATSSAVNVTSSFQEVQKRVKFSRWQKCGRCAFDGSWLVASSWLRLVCEPSVASAQNATAAPPQLSTECSWCGQPGSIGCPAWRR